MTRTNPRLLIILTGLAAASGCLATDTQRTNALLTGIALGTGAPILAAAGPACEVDRIDELGTFTADEVGICNAENYGKACRQARAQADAACAAACLDQNKLAPGHPTIIGPRCVGVLGGVTRARFDPAKHCIQEGDRTVGARCVVSATCSCDP